ncbi:hypothetical protein [Photorhabdus heterorhabditis]|uniref:hypothetical protein n=1 Tax=Photorhabdus heterorhabditis TaxID=880156 RepID=UPI001BD67248|nr:hypothetical protein [Photorhabdus heterorhabditis]MBS9442446.1 hypothetical protein [Photorhabdus heterorhabditis]
MTKNTETLISACHELARIASRDDYLILNEIAGKLKSLRKERESYKGMFVESCLGLGAIANAVGIKAEDDSGSPGQVIDKIESMLNIDWNFTEHPDIKVGEEMKCWAYVEIKDNESDSLLKKVIMLTWINKPTPTCEDINDFDFREKLEEKWAIPSWAVENDYYLWLNMVGWHHVHDHPDYNGWYQPIDEELKVIAWAPIIYPAAPEINNE